MSYPRMGARNRQILLSFLAGLTVDDLAIQYRLRRTTISAILVTERHKCAVSPAPEYRAFREKQAQAVQEAPAMEASEAV